MSQFALRVLFNLTTAVTTTTLGALHFSWRGADQL